MNTMAQRLAICFILAMLEPYAFGAAGSPDLWFSVRVKDRYNPDFRVCSIIGSETPFKIEWANGPIKNKITGQLGKTDGEVYPLTFLLEEFVKGEQQFSSTEGLKLKLESLTEEDFVASSLFNDVHHLSALLTRHGCQ
jgi:hypothetical protein